MLSNGASEPEIDLPGKISAGLYSGKPQNRPSGRPSAGRKADFDSFPMKILPGRPDFLPGCIIAVT
jgi:hypothetical protein